MTGVPESSETRERSPGSAPGEFGSQTAALAERLIDAARSAAGAPPTAWSLRLKLNVPLSRVYLALGRLQAEGRISLEPDGLTLRVKVASPAPPSASAGPRPGTAEVPEPAAATPAHAQG